MTAPDPTAEHIDAVNELVHVWIIDCDIYGPLGGGKYLCTIHDEFTESDAYCGAVDEASRRILTSTDPAVHAALAASLPAEVKAASMTDAEMLAALVDRGTLTAEAHCVHARAAQADGDYRTYTCEDAGTTCPPDRLVTEWEVAP